MAVSFKKNLRRVEGALIALGILAIVVAKAPIPGLEHVKQRILGQKTVDDVVRQHEETVLPELRSAFAAAGCSYPPSAFRLLVFKEEKRIELWAGGPSRFHYVKTYPILKVSGDPGPKLRRGDLQVPEGVYRMTALHPNSAFHLSIKIDYPNAFDRTMAEKEGRQDLGDDIFLHGGASSVGCIAIGDAAAEELFLLTAQSGLKNGEVIIAPWDFRAEPERPVEASLPWVEELYQTLRDALAQFPLQTRAVHPSAGVPVSKET